MRISSISVDDHDAGDPVLRPDICLYILCTPTTLLLLLLLWLLAHWIGMMGRLTYPTLPSISHGFSCLNPCVHQSPISFPSCLCLFHCLHSPLPHSLFFQPTTLLCCLFWFYCRGYWVGPLLLVLALLDSTPLFIQRVWARVCLSITYPSPSFEPFLFLLHDVVHTPSPLFPISAPLSTADPSGWPMFPIPSINHLSLFHRCSHHPSPALAFDMQTPPNLHTPLSIMRRHPIHHHLNYILYFLSSVSPNPPSLAFFP